MELVPDPNTISTCSTCAAVAGQDVVDPRADEPRAELGERPAQVGALADPRAAAGTRPGPGPELLEARHGEAGVPTERISVVAVNSAWRAAIDHAGRGHQLLDERRLGPVADLDDGPAWRLGPARRPPSGRPSAAPADPGRDVEHQALVPGGAGQLRELVVGRAASPRRRAEPAACGVAGDHLRQAAPA